MSKFLIFYIVLVICILNAHCAIPRYSDEHRHRQVRSPHYGGYFFGGPPGPPPPPPPPPFVYHTHNWSGVARSLGGRPQGVFSGAAATAGNVAPNNEALALATADAGGQSENCDDGTKIDGSSESSQYSKATLFSDKNFRSISEGYGAGIGSSGSQSLGHFGQFKSASGYATHSGGSGLGGVHADESNSGSAEPLGSHPGQYKALSSNFANTAANAGVGLSGVGQHNNGFGHENSQLSGVQSGYGGSSGGFLGGQNHKETHFSSHSGALNQGGYNGNQQIAEKGFTSSQSQITSFENDGNSVLRPQQAGFSKPYKEFEANNQAVGSHSQLSGVQKEASSDFKYDHQIFGSHSNEENQHSQQLQSASSFGQAADLHSGISSNGQTDLSSSSAGSGVRGDAHAAFSGALDLASQSLQAANKAGCSTCQKSNYALSNAKSYNGNAISLAIGG